MHRAERPWTGFCICGGKITIQRGGCNYGPDLTFCENSDREIWSTEWVKPRGGHRPWPSGISFYW